MPPQPRQLPEETLALIVHYANNIRDKLSLADLRVQRAFYPLRLEYADDSHQLTYSHAVINLSETSRSLRRVCLPVLYHDLLLRPPALDFMIPDPDPDEDEALQYESDPECYSECSSTEAVVGMQSLEEYSRTVSNEITFNSHAGLVKYLRIDAFTRSEGD